MVNFQKIDIKNIDDIIALIPMQEGMLFIYLNEPGSDLYFEQLSLNILGTIDRDIFEKAWGFVVETNEMLRTVFRWEKLKKPVQIVLKNHKPNIRYVDISGDGRQKELLENLKLQDRKEKFNLKNVPFRVSLCKIAEANYEMIISNHHILYDGWSTGIILGEFFNAYNQFYPGNEPQKPVKAKFKDFVKGVLDQDTKSQEKFWREYLEGFENPTRLHVPNDNGNELPGGKEIENHEIGFPGDIKDGMQRFIQEYKVTFAALLYGAWGLLLQKYKNTEDVVLGTTVSARPGTIKGIEEVVGLFINTIPLRVCTHASETNLEVILRINDVLRVRDGFAGTPLVKVKEYSQLNRQQELFESIIVIENYPLVQKFLPDDCILSVNSYSIFDITNYDLALLINSDEVIFNYNRQLFDEGYIERLSYHYMRMLRGITRFPEAKVSDLEILSEEDKTQILKEMNETAAGDAGGKTIEELEHEIDFDFR